MFLEGIFEFFIAKRRILLYTGRNKATD